MKSRAANECLPPNQLPAIRGSGFRRFIWRKVCRTSLVASVAVVLYKNLGVSNAAIAFYTGWLYLPWVIKPLWSPVVDLLKTRRQWIWAMQLLLGAGLAGVALTIPAPHFFQLTLAFFWLLAFSSATHDIAADGFYMLATTEREQSLFRRHSQHCFIAWRRLRAQGGLVILGRKNPRTHRQLFTTAWSVAFALVAGIFLCFWHFITGWFCRVRRRTGARRGLRRKIFRGISSRRSAHFFRSRKSACWLLFLLLYRLGEAQLLKMAQLFLLDPRGQGGLGLTNDQFGWIYGTVGVVRCSCSARCSAVLWWRGAA